MGDKSEMDGIAIMRREGVRTVPLYQIYKAAAGKNSGKKVKQESTRRPRSLVAVVARATSRARMALRYDRAAVRWVALLACSRSRLGEKRTRAIFSVVVSGTALFPILRGSRGFSQC